MPLLAGKPPKWDAADATIDERKSIIEAALKLEPEIIGRRPFRLSDWSTLIYMGVPEEERWLVREVFPLGTVVMLAASGDTGKGMMLLDLSLNVAQEPKDGIDVLPATAFGCTIVERGAVVILSAEDTQGEIHRRIKGLDPARERLGKAAGKLVIVPMPNAGGSRPLAIQNGGKMELTPFFEDFRLQLKKIPNLKLVVIDPLASFAHIDVNADPHAAYFIFDVLGELAQETGATFLVSHHMSKGDAKRPISGPESARAAIRGTTGLVDRTRATYAIWPADPQEARKVCRDLKIEHGPNIVFRGAIVKANFKADRTVRTYIRNEKTGLLQDRTQRIIEVTPPRDELADLLVDEIKRAAEENDPFVKHGKNSPFERAGEMRPEFHNIKRERFDEMVDALIKEERIVRCNPRRRAGALDLQGGPFATGSPDAVIETKARPTRKQKETKI